jgi:hypothetical protein
MIKPINSHLFDFMDILYRRYTRWLLGLPILIFVVLGVFNYIVDPYMLWHRKPIWYDFTKNPVIDHHQRLVKSLQLILRQPKVVFVGSSRVYHVINPEQTLEPYLYNFGVGSLRIAEAYTYIEEAIKWTSVKKIYLALDLFAFGNEQMMPGYDPQSATFQYLSNQLLASLIGESTTVSSWDILRGKNNHYNDGTWQFNGYKITPKRSLEEINHGLVEDRQLYQQIYAQHPRAVIASNMQTVAKMIALCKAHHVELILYFNPLNHRLLNTYEQLGLTTLFAELKSELTTLAKKQHVTLWDFATRNEVTQYPFDTEQEIGRNPYYVDADHASEVVGNYMMQTMGITLKKPVVVPKDFGVLLNRS